MFKRFYPKQYSQTLNDIDFAKLKESGISNLIFDLDNTLAPYYREEPEEREARFIAALIERGFKICILSNNREARVSAFCNKLGGVCTVAKSGKPSIKAAEKALALLGCAASEAAVIGDQLFTDIYCGNRAGIFTILIKPLYKDEFTVRLKRPFEKIVFLFYRRRVKDEKN